MKGVVKGCEQLYFYQSSGAITICKPAVGSDRSIPGGWDVRPVPFLLPHGVSEAGIAARV